MTQIVQINTAQLQWRASLAPSGVWIGVCDAMNLSTEANSLDELHSVINESIQLLFFDLLTDNELDRFLSDHGWKAAQMIPHHVANQADIKFDVPWELVAEGQRPSRDPKRRIS